MSNQPKDEETEARIKDQIENNLGDSMKPKTAKHSDLVRALEVTMISQWLNGKRMKQLCKPFKMSIKQVEDTLRRGFARRTQYEEPPEEVKEKIDSEIS